MKKTILTLALSIYLLVAPFTANATNPANENETTVSTTKVRTIGASKQIVFILKDGRKAVYNVNYGSSNLLALYEFTGRVVIKSNVKIEARIYSANGKNFLPLNIYQNYFLTQKVATLLNIDLAH